jgi:hypothetical protein
MTTRLKKYHLLILQQIVTEAGITAGNLRTAKYRMAANVNASLSITQKKKLGIIPKKSNATRKHPI